MDILDYFDKSEQYIELINPTSIEKIMKLGRVLRLNRDSRVIDFGCGYAEMLVKWAVEFGISGIGIEIRQKVCDSADKKIAGNGLDEKIKVFCGNGSEYRFQEKEFDVASCLGATFIWSGFKSAIQAMKPAIKTNGRLAIGEAYWLKEDIPANLAERMKDVETESEMLKIARREGFDLEFIIRASNDDWDNYEASNWLGALQWIEENPGHPQRQDMIDMVRSSQDFYINYSREYIGWAIYVLKPTM